MTTDTISQARLLPNRTQDYFLVNAEREARSRGLFDVPDRRHRLPLLRDVLHARDRALHGEPEHQAQLLRLLARVHPGHRAAPEPGRAHRRRAPEDRWGHRLQGRRAPARRGPRGRPSRRGHDAAVDGGDGDRLLDPAADPDAQHRRASRSGRPERSDVGASTAGCSRTSSRAIAACWRCRSCRSTTRISACDTSRRSATIAGRRLHDHLSAVPADPPELLHEGVPCAQTSAACRWPSTPRRTGSSARSPCSAGSWAPTRSASILRDGADDQRRALGPARALQEHQVDLHGGGPGLGAVLHRAARQRVQAALRRGASAGAPAQRVHQGLLLLDAALREPRRPEGHAGR